jgi:hypothetical protein
MNQRSRVEREARESKRRRGKRREGANGGVGRGLEVGGQIK